MIIVVEGIDRVGKTTLVNTLQKVTGFPVYKNCTSFKLEEMDSDNEADKMLKMLQVCELSGADMIFDRFHWTDTVYGCLQRGYNVKNAMANLKAVESKLNEMEAIIILVRPTNVNKSSAIHGSDLKAHSQMFDMLFNVSNARKIACDFNTLGIAAQRVNDVVVKSSLVELKVNKEKVVEEFAKYVEEYK